MTFAPAALDTSHQDPEDQVDPADVVRAEVERRLAVGRAPGPLRAALFVQWHCP